MKEKLSVKKCTSCWGDEMYFGFVGSRQYTEGYETISELEDDNPQFKACRTKEQKVGKKNAKIQRWSKYQYPGGMQSHTSQRRLLCSR